MRALFTSITTALLFAIPAIAWPQEGALARLAWMAGCWAPQGGEAGSGEIWLPLAGGTMLGVGRTVKNGKTVEYEFLRIHLNEQGNVAYTAVPSGQREVTFVALTIADDSVTFENLQHDFPQRVIYKALTGDRLAARIEGMRGGTLRSRDFAMKRVRCEAPSGS